jgi:hypothetical protein
MNAKIDYDLTLDQWEALKALRMPLRRDIARRLTSHLVPSRQEAPA